MTPNIFESLSSVDRAQLRPGTSPQWVDPMLATLTDRRFSDTGWIFERKFDGIRCLTFYHGSTVKLLSRRKQRLDGTYPEIVDEIEAQRWGDFVIDGEIVAHVGSHTSFELLQQRSGITNPEVARRSSVKIRYYVFDLLYLDGFDLRHLPLKARKQLLRSALSYRDPLMFTPHRNTKGVEYFEEACRRGWEGLIAKRADSIYASRRSPAWLKFKCAHGQEFAVGGFTEPRGTRIGFGALLLGYYDDEGAFHYAGKVGTGFDEKLLRDVTARLGKLEVKESPFAGNRRFERGTHFVRPELVGEVGFAEWTRDGLLRQPRFLGLREDKLAREVRKERPLESSPR